MYLYIYIYLFIYIYLCVCACVCVCIYSLFYVFIYLVIYLFTFVCNCSMHYQIHTSPRSVMDMLEIQIDIVHIDTYMVKSIDWLID